MVERGFGDRVALVGNGRARTYKELSDWTNRLAHALVADYGLRPGNRVLIRSANNPAMVAAWLVSAGLGRRLESDDPPPTWTSRNTAEPAPVSPATL